MKRKLVGLFVVLAILVGCLPNVVWAATGNDIANAAWNYLGVSRNYYDCSAFTQKAYSDCGISIPRLTYDQANCGTRIYSRNINDLQPGDIICFGSSSNSSDISHVGIYCGNNVVLHSSYSKWQIAQDNMSSWISSGYYSPPYQFAVRVISGGSHSHSYNGIYSESAHPHKEYKICSCGQKQYTGNTCYLSSCSTCNPPITVFKRVHCWRIITISGTKVYLYANPTDTTLTKYYYDDLKYRSYSHIILSNGKIRYEVEAEAGTFYFEPGNGVSVEIEHNYGGKPYNYDKAHPHKKYQTCDCGHVYYDSKLVNPYGYDENCEQCNPYYTLTYNANGGTNSPSSQSAKYGQDIKVSSTKPKRDGYIFVGWGNDSNSISASYAGGSTLSMPQSNKTLYAIWREVTDSNCFSIDNYGSYVEVTNYGKKQTAAVIIARYQDGILLDASENEMVFSSGESHTFSVSGDYKVFVWDSLSGMKSLTE